ncbi:uncharacterized protein LOC119448671 [Dermacentor silvarum]|uniref:uncharacterized protein LOC119448671 n=1 Tax=Dermacentor silvarum TaxID=543639 RepID=UPI0021018D4E|nr:uncharacterized protein LOC119448671 [Dermacentor silvarum]
MSMFCRPCVMLFSFQVAQRTERLREVSKPVRDEDMIRRTTSFRRALSATDMANQGGLMPGMAPVIRAPPRTRGGMHSKTMSLGQGMAAADLRIWGSGDSLVYTPYGSQNSLRGGRTGYDSDASVVSEPPRHWRYSRPAVRVESENESSNPGSTEDVTTATKHRKTLKERLKLLKKPSTHEPKQDSGKNYVATGNSVIIIIIPTTIISVIITRTMPTAEERGPL